MSNSSPKPRHDPAQTLTGALAVVAGLGGFVTLFIVVGVLLLGLWIDQQMNTRPLFTILLMVMSAPVSIFVMYRVAMSAIQRLQPPPQKSQGEAQANYDD